MVIKSIEFDPIKTPADGKRYGPQFVSCVVGRIVKSQRFELTIIDTHCAKFIPDGEWHYPEAFSKTTDGANICATMTVLSVFLDKHREPEKGHTILTSERERLIKWVNLTMSEDRLRGNYDRRTWDWLGGYHKFIGLDDVFRMIAFLHGKHPMQIDHETKIGATFGEQYPESLNVALDNLYRMVECLNRLYGL